MNLCSNDHDEVCFDGRSCPVCELRVSVDKLEAKIVGLEAECKTLAEERDAVEDRLANLKDQQ